MRKSLTSEIPLMSRDAEMGEILAKLKSPKPAAFVLAGAAGVGKTRLASEAARSAAGLGFATAQAVASRAAAAIPFGPFAPLLPVTDRSPGDLLGLLQQASDAITGRAGELSRAVEILAEAAARAAAASMRIAEARVLHDIARLGQPESVAPRLAALAELADGGFVAALAGHAAALADPKAADLEAAGHAFETLGASLLAAEAYLAAAAAYRSDGLARPASAMARRAGELAASCGDVRTPGLSFGTDTERLTRREREVAGMAAAGASSREIAAKLVLSVRTSTTTSRTCTASWV